VPDPVREETGGGRDARPLADAIDVYECLPCGRSLTVSADAETFSSPPPLECENCERDMQARRYAAASASSSKDEEGGLWSVNRPDDRIPAEVVMWCCPSCGWTIGDENAIDPQPCESYLEGDGEDAARGLCGDCERIVFYRRAAPSVSQQETGERSRAAQMLDEFHRVFAHPDDTPASRRDCRAALHEEEHAELMEALRFANATSETRHVFLAALARELADVVYVAYGTAHAYELDLDAALAEVHRANMSKLGPDGEVLQDEHGKVIKGPNFVPPDMTAALASVPSQQKGGDGDG